LAARSVMYLRLLERTQIATLSGYIFTVYFATRNSLYLLILNHFITIYM
jgi:hypothetical protein